MSTARIFRLAYTSSFIRTLEGSSEAVIDLVTGFAGLAEMMQLGTGLAMGALSSLPIAGLLLAAAGIMKALDESYHAPQGEDSDGDPACTTVNAETHTKSFIRVMSNGGALANYAYQTMTLGSSAFSAMCGSMAIRAAGEFFIDLHEYFKASNLLATAKTSMVAQNSTRDWYKINPEITANYVEARRKLTFSFLNLLGWGLLAAAHLPIMATAAAPLLAGGFTALAIAGLYAGWTAYQRYSNALMKETSSSDESGWGDTPSPEPHRAAKTSPSKLEAFYSLFWNPAYGAEASQDNDMPPKAEAEKELAQNLTVHKL